MTTTVKQKKIRAFIGLPRLSDGLASPILKATVKGLNDHISIYPKTPYDLATYGGAVTAYDDAIPAALDGGKVAVAQKNKLRGTATDMYVQIAHYVESNCNDDLSTFLLSGFQTVPTTRTKTPPVSDAIRKVAPGPNSGQMAIVLMKSADAVHHELHWGSMSAGAAPTTWSSQPVVGIRNATIISGLTPGTVYAFQVRALTKAGYSDWSDSVTRMCM
jgi:hypothetical protein